MYFICIITKHEVIIMPARQLIVANQRNLSGGHESCGYHTFKNSLLSLMRIQGLIDQKQFERMLQDTALFEAVYDKCNGQADAFGNKDLSLPVMLEILTAAKTGAYDFSAQGLSSDILKSLDITQDGNEKISVINFSTDMIDDGADLGHFGGDESLITAASLAKLAKTKGEAGHVVALGINNQHWVSAMVKQNNGGERSWEFMDSYGNQNLYFNRSVDAVEKILRKSESELRDYLYAIYEEVNDTFNN